MIRLSALSRNQTAVIKRTVGMDPSLSDLGFLPGAEVQVVYEAPLGKDPIAVRIRGALIALRRKDADQIEVEVK